jgi:hypothetical protein
MKAFGSIETWVETGKRQRYESHRLGGNFLENPQIADSSHALDDGR